MIFRREIKRIPALFLYISYDLVITVEMKYEHEYYC